VIFKTGPVYRSWALDRLPSRLAEFAAALMAPVTPPTPATTPGQADATEPPSK
jgi:hypothetical protein